MPAVAVLSRAHTRSIWAALTLGSVLICVDLVGAGQVLASGLLESSFPEGCDVSRVKKQPGSGEALWVKYVEH